MTQEVIDVDAHFLEPFDELLPYFDEPLKTNLKNGGDFSRGFFFPGTSGDRAVGGRIQREKMTSEEFEESGADGAAPTAYHEDYNLGTEGGMEPEEVPQMMEFLGVDKMIVLSHLMLAYPRMVADDFRAVGVARGSLNYMLDKLVDPNEGIYTALQVPYHDPELSVELIEEFKDEKSVVAVVMVSAGAEPPMGNRKYEPIYQAAEDAGLPVIFHSGGSGIDEYHIKGYEKFIETHTLGFLNGNMAQITSVVLQGLPEKFPDLDFIFQESGVMYIPMIMYRLDEEYKKRQSEAPLLKKLPSEYIKEMYFGTQPLEKPPDQELFKKIFEVIDGPDQLMYASDYPHWDFDRPNSVTDIPFLSDADRDNILSNNAAEVFDL